MDPRTLGRFSLPMRVGPKMACGVRSVAMPSAFGPFLCTQLVHFGFRNTTAVRANADDHQSVEIGSVPSRPQSPQTEIEVCFVPSGR